MAAMASASATASAAMRRFWRVATAAAGDVGGATAATEVSWVILACSDAVGGGHVTAELAKGTPALGPW